MAVHLITDVNSTINKTSSRYSAPLYCSLEEFTLACESLQARNILMDVALQDAQIDRVFTRREAIEMIAQAILIWLYIDSLLFKHYDKFLHLLKIDIERARKLMPGLEANFRLASDDGLEELHRVIRQSASDNTRKAAALKVAREYRRELNWW